MLTIGIDIGSVTTKGVLMADGDILAAKSCFTGYHAEAAARSIFAELLECENLSEASVEGVVATGYGRNSVPFADKAVTEIMCHAAGASHLNPDVRAVIDIGGQDSKAILLGDRGRVLNFIMNDKCAAGTGRFLEVIAETLGIKLTDLAEIASKAEGLVKISNLCTVFAEHEVTTHLARGAGIPRIVAGLHEAIAGRVVNMVRHLGIEKDVVITGGGAKNAGLVQAIAGKVGFGVLVPDEPFITGALGAAFLGKDSVARGMNRDRERRIESVTFFS